MSEKFCLLIGAPEQPWLSSSLALSFFSYLASVCMQSLPCRKRKGSKTGSMCLTTKRTGSVVECSWFFHIKGFFFMLLFLRGALT
ncbi:hypothetical protein H6P81_008923 [Aristolochia fimbriata]|uniref:Uncharacterized protein n=1 Tax=Aristolochia fimbriata TaxID=158543 RepID=A0AAV7EJE2_ARIFI|nr:hypothetical protein H6P81_008923 [Aristolochia fimbriata]